MDQKAKVLHDEIFNNKNVSDGFRIEYYWVIVRKFLKKAEDKESVEIYVLKN